MVALAEIIQGSLLSLLRERFGRFEILAVQENVLVVRLAEVCKGARVVKLHGRWERGKKEGLVLEHLSSLDGFGKGFRKGFRKGFGNSTFNRKEIKKEGFKNRETKTVECRDCPTVLTPRLCFSYPLHFISGTGELVESASLGRVVEKKEEKKAFKLWVLGMDDVRKGRDPRCRRLSRMAVCLGAGILGCIHSAPLPQTLTQRNGWEVGWRHLHELGSSHELSLPLKKQLEKLVFIGDALCHKDLHPSNWITQQGNPVGLLDWASAGVGDPESDLAGLMLATDVDWAGLSGEGDKGRRELFDTINEVCGAWSSAAFDMNAETSGKDVVKSAGRLADPVRVQLYMWLSVEEELLSIKRNNKDPGRIADLEALRELLAEELSQSSPCFGSLEKPRNVCSTQMTAEKHDPPHDPSYEDKKRIIARWIEAQEQDVGLLWRALVREGVISDSGWSAAKFGRHACNDVVRFRRNHELSDAACYESFVAKVYNKPIPPFLFPLEMRLCKMLDGTRVSNNADARVDAGIVVGEELLRCVCVPSPVVLPSGRLVFRVGDRLALLYEDVGNDELDSTSGTLRKVARAQAALHSLGDEVHDLLSFSDDEPVYLDECLDVGRSLVQTTEEMDQLNEAVHWLQGQLQFIEDASDEAMLSTLVHGSLHRDHCLLSADGRIVVFDFEKASWGHRIKDAAITAYYMGYRSNSETLDPARIVAYLVHYSGAVSPRLSREEQAFLVPYLLRVFFHDLRILPVEGREEKDLRRHFHFLLDFFWNRNRLESVFERVFEK